jgi:glycosyltransferase involved in cell wall biosynthesis
MYNEVGGLELLFSKLVSVMTDCSGYRFEIDCVNDGSTDNTLLELISYQSKVPNVRVINLSRNFGKEAALTAGLNAARGEAVIPLDADLQDPPEIIKEMLSRWQKGAQVVLCKRSRRDEESWLKRSSAKLFYKVMTLLSDTPIHENVGDFRLMDRKVVDVIISLHEKNRMMKGIMSWPGFKTEIIEFVRPSRAFGKSSIGLSKLIRLAIDGILSFSSIPLKISMYLGISIAMISFFYGSYLIYKTLVMGVDLPGYASMMVTILFMGGLQLISMGIMGEYIARIYSEVKGRPIFVIEKIYEPEQ